MKARNRTRAALLIAWGLLAAGTPWLSRGAQAAEGAEAVLVLGFPRSMWIQINHRTKASILKKTLKTVLPSLKGKLRLGVESFGASGSGCKDIGKVQDVGAVDPPAYLKSVEALKPKGAAPLAAAIEHANGMFQADGQPKTIVVVTDSVDSCKEDPCATVKALREGSTRLTVHVIAFDRHSKTKLKSLACVAGNAKGLFATAANESELETALRTAFAAAAAHPVASMAETPPASGDPAQVTLTASLAQGLPPLTSDSLTWRIFEGKARDDGSYRLLHTLHQPGPVLWLKPGLYLVNAAFGKSNVTKKIAVWPARPTQNTFILNAGGIRLYATLNKTEVIPDNLVSFDIYSEESDQSGNRLKIISKGKPGVIFRLNSGTYRVTSVYGDCNALVESEVKVEAGKLAETTFNHDAARITFRLVDHPGGEALADTTWTIAAPDGEIVKESAGAFPSHILAAGSYKVTARHGLANYVQDFVVKGGENRQVEVLTR
jgi:hypothetical protein